MSSWLLVLLKIGLLGLMVWLGLRWFERSNMYFPDKTLTANPRSFGMAFDEVQLVTSDRKEIHGWYIPAPHPSSSPLPGERDSEAKGEGASASAVLFCHGNAGNISHRMDKARRLHTLGVHALFFDYRGYGQSQGRPSEEGTYRDAEAAYRYLVDTRKIAPDEIVLYGESLGCAVAVEIARRHSVGGIILESPFTSTVDVAKLVFPFLPVRWMVHNLYDNRAKVPDLNIPILILHSAQDEIISFRMGKELYESAREPKKLVPLSGDHNEGYSQSGNLYTQAIAEFLRGLKKVVK